MCQRDNKLTKGQKTAEGHQMGLQFSEKTPQPEACFSCHIKIKMYTSSVITDVILNHEIYQRNKIKNHTIKQRPEAPDVGQSGAKMQHG